MRIKLDVFGLGQLQSTLTILGMAVSDGITDVRVLQEQLAEHIHTKAMEGSVIKRKAAKSSPQRQALIRGVVGCSKCGEPAKVERVNVCPSTKVGGKWKSSISCTNHACLHIELSEKTVQEVTS
jgi:hypothetical protein